MALGERAGRTADVRPASACRRRAARSPSASGRARSPWAVTRSTADQWISGSPVVPAAVRRTGAGAPRGPVLRIRRNLRKGTAVVPMRWEVFLEQVQERGEYVSPQEAERAARVVLALLGAHLVGEERAELAACLPETFELILLNPLQAAEPLDPERYVRATAAWIEGATEETAKWDVGAVLSVVADAMRRGADASCPAPAAPGLRPPLRPSPAGVTRSRRPPRRAPVRPRRPGPGSHRNSPERPDGVGQTDRMRLFAAVLPPPPPSRNWPPRWRS